MSFMEAVLQVAIQSPLATWGATLSTVLGGIKIWEVFFKDRVRLDTSFLFTDEPGGAHEIDIANLSPIPVQISAWTLAYEPRLFRWNLETVELTHAYNRGFRIDGHSSKKLSFSGIDKFAWGSDAPSNTNLCLTLHIFGRTRPKRLRVDPP